MNDDFDKIIEDQKALHERVLQLLVGLKSQAEGERKVIAALKSERETAVKATSEAQDKRHEFEQAARDAKVQSMKAQADYTALQAKFDALRTKVASL
jgi:hypothetical protein